MKTKTLTALDQALADLGVDYSQQSPDEFSVYDFADQSGMPRSMANEKLLNAVRSGQYSRRKFGKLWLYRKVDTPAKKR